MSFGKIYCSSWWGNESNKLSVPYFPDDCSLLPSICGTQYSYSGNASFPESYKLDLGGSIGVSTLTFEAYSYPDKWVLVQDGQVILDTGYRGDASTQQTILNDALALRGLPPETIQGIGQGSIDFTVSSSSPVYVYVYAPIEGTAYNFTVSCPVSSQILSLLNTLQARATYFENFNGTVETLTNLEN